MAEVLPLDVGAPVDWEQLFAQQQVLTRAIMDSHARVLEILCRLEEPASVEPIQLTATNPVYESNTIGGTLSIGLLNPVNSTGTVALGLFGSATSADAIQVQPGGLLVLPIRVGVCEVAAVTPPAAGVTLYAYLFRFKTVQRVLT